MIARCPQCQTRFRLAPDKIGAQGARIRCSKCQTIFRVAATGEGEAAAPAAVPEPVSERAPTRAAQAAAPPASAPIPVTPAVPAATPKPAATPAPARGPRILVAEADADAAKVVVEVLGRWGLAAEVVHDGSEALLWIHRKKPPAAVLGGHLPGVSAPVIAEIVRRTAELAQVKLIRIAPIDEPLGAPEFEADRAVEPGELAHGIEAALESLNLGLRPSPVVSTPPEAPKPAVEAPRAPSADPEVAAAERLARIIVSDIVLYNQEKFLAAARAGNVASALEAELTEASALFRQRIPEAVRAKRNFLVEELERRAKS